MSVADSQLSEATWTHRAVLIGVGLNIDVSNQGNPPNDRSLRGAVPDINAFSEYFKSEPHVKITKLTASRPVDAGSTSPPSEAQEDLSTLDNVCSVLQGVIQDGNDGLYKHVYIHFSGHGTRIPGTGEFALVLYQNSTRGAKYLRRSELIYALNQIAKNGMYITLVLDCCFSAGVTRTDQLADRNIRFLEYDPIVDAESDAGKHFGLEHRDVVRDSVLHLDLPLDPKRYSMITACGPREAASEIEFRGGARRGALSYYLDFCLRRLRTAHSKITYLSLFQHLQARFHADYPQQSPMRFGHPDVFFFESIMHDLGLHFVPVFRDTNNNRLILNAGHAHGVHEEDEYDAFSSFKSEDDKAISSGKSIKLRVKSVADLTSELLVVDPSDAENFEIRSTWKAKPLTSFSPRKILIGLMPSLPEPDREKLLRETRAHRFLRFAADKWEIDSSVFQLLFNNEENYEVHESSRSHISSLPSVPGNRDQGLEAVRIRLDHLARFKFFEAIENQHPDPEFGSCFSLEVNSDIGPDGWFDLKHGDTWQLTFKNLCDSPLYFVIFDLRPSWEVCNLMWESEGRDFIVIPPRPDPESVESFEVTMEVRPEYIQATGQYQCEDIMKTFVTSRSTAFPGMSLPALHDSNLRGGSDRLTNFVREFIGGLRGDREGGREGRWATRNFLIRTLAESAVG